MLNDAAPGGLRNGDGGEDSAGEGYSCAEWGGAGVKVQSAGRVWSRVVGSRTMSESITLTRITWFLSPFCAGGAHSVWPLPVVRKPTKKSI